MTRKAGVSVAMLPALLGVAVAVSWRGAQAQAPWTLSADRATTWAPGVPGGVPARATVCASLPAGSSASQLQAAVDTCPPGQVVRLAAGEYVVNTPVVISRGITLRGAGPGTVLRKTDGAKPGSYQPANAAPILVVGAVRWSMPDGVSRPLTVDGVKGERSVTLTSATGIVVGHLVLVDEDGYSAGADWRALPPRGGVATTARVWATDRVVWQRHQPAAPEDDLFPAAASWFSRPGRPTAEWKEVAAVAGNVVTFTTPLHITYRRDRAAQLVALAGPVVAGAGVEDLRLEGGSDGALRFEGALRSWAARIDCGVWLGECVSIANSHRVEIRDSYIHDAVWPEPGGGGYAISLAKGASEALIENNVVRMANKVMVARSAGAGSVVAYNYLDDGFIQSNTQWQEVGVNGSHMAGPHHMLFEGNLAFNADSDDTHGNSIYQTYFRNHLTGDRTSFADGANARAAGAMYGSWWHTFAGNVLGRPGEMGAWVFQEAQATPGQSSIWKLGYAPIHWDQAPDPQVLATVERVGNFDHERGQTDTVASLPDSLYLTGKPAFFGDCRWPWVDASNPVFKTYELPAKLRFEGRACSPPATPAPPPTTTTTTTTMPVPPTPPPPTPSPCPIGEQKTLTWPSTIEARNAQIAAQAALGFRWAGHATSAVYERVRCVP